MMLPPQVHVFVRDWLSSNQVVLKSDDGCVVVDSGYGKHVPLTLALVASRMGLDGRPLSKLVNTHCHSDHIGGNASLRRAYGCPIAIPAGEAPLIGAWDEHALLLGYADQRAERFAADELLQPGTTHVWGGLEWRALAAPGHDMGALVFFNDEHRILISGDALWQDGYGFVMPPEIDPLALPATRATLEMIAKLDAGCVIPGHGEPFSGHREWITATIGHHHERCDEIFGLVHKSPQTAHRMVAELWRKQLSPINHHFAIFEVLAHLEYMQRQGRVTHRDEHGALEWHV